LDGKVLKAVLVNGEHYMDATVLGKDITLTLSVNPTKYVSENNTVSLVYEDERNSVLHYKKDLDYEDEYLNKICKIINALRYRKLESEDKISDYKNIDLDRVSELYCNDDWFYIIYTNGIIETYSFSFDKRSQNELNKILNLPKEKIKK
jgi:hypothetical protein